MNIFHGIQNLNREVFGNKNGYTLGFLFNIGCMEGSGIKAIVEFRDVIGTEMGLLQKHHVCFRFL